MVLEAMPPANIAANQSPATIVPPPQPIVGAATAAPVVAMAVRQAAQPFPPNIPPNGLALSTSANVQHILSEPWQNIEVACEYILTTLANNVGNYDTQQTLEVYSDVKFNIIL